MFAHRNGQLLLLLMLLILVLSLPALKNRAHSRNVLKSAEYLFISPHCINNHQVFWFEPTPTCERQERGDVWQKGN